MKKKFALTLGAILVVVAILAGGKAMQISTLIEVGSGMQAPPEVVSSVQSQRVNWESILTSVGSAEAAKGVTITADLPGRITKILFIAGAEVKAGDILLEQDIDAENAQLRAATASVDLAKKNLTRMRDLWEKKLVSQSQYDSAMADYDSAVGQADNLRTNIEKRVIRAPFDGRLGIRQVNLGQDINEGQAIVSLQAADLMYVNFSLPQKRLSLLRSGLTVRVTTDAAPGAIIEGVLTTVSPEIDPATRSVKLQATFANSDRKLLPGMFARVEVILDTKEDVLIVPSTAISFATFGDSVFVLEKPENSDEKDALVARQQFVRLGKTRGDFVVIEKGLNEGDVVVATGVFKLQNGASVSIDNKNALDYRANPQPKDS